tara:strand:+ start:832 stop:1587 length:756 start_codon:yes stop_codon:yes gene_type:complete
VIPLFLFILGSIFGSFFNVCIYRLPRELDVIKKNSFCPSCKYKIPFYQNIPILTYLFNFGKCKNCKDKINISYFIVELLTALIFLFSYFKYDLSLEFIFFIIFYCSLLIIFFTDLKEYLILDIITIPVSIIGLGGVFLKFNPFGVGLTESIIGGLVGYGVIYLIRFIYFKIRKVEGMGLGDAKLFLLIGIWLGFKSIFLILMFSSLIGAIVGSIIIFKYKKSRDFQIPYGCFITLTAALYPFFGQIFYNYI